VKLTVLTVNASEEKADSVINEARNYLEPFGILATYLTSAGKAVESIMSTVEENECDLILIGGYGASPIKEIVLGSTVDGVLQSSSVPILICR
jgi:nucleotide-binding universal stress UspA family protein